MKKKIMAAKSALLVIAVAACVTQVISDQYPLCVDVTGSGTLTNVTLTDCLPNTRCEIRAGSPLIIEIYFIPARDSSTLTVTMHGILAGLPIPLPFPGIDHDGCQVSHGIECPIRAFQPYRYHVNVRVPSTMPTPYNVQARIALLDDNDDTIVCFTDHLRIIH